MTEFRFTADLWRSMGTAPWFFVTLPHDVADDIDEIAQAARTGFGSVRVNVTVGATTWATSVFPDTKAASYVLPVKAAVRRAEALDAGSPVSVRMTLAT